MKIIAYLTLGVILLGSLSGCTSQNKKSLKKTIAVSILPQKYFIDQIAGNHYNVLVMVSQGSSPETYEPTASQLTELSQATIYFRLGNLDFENTMLRGINDNFPYLKVVNCSQGINLISSIEPEEEKNHHHAIDPHIWISPKTVKVIAQHIYSSLIEVDPTYADSLKIGYNKFINSIDSLDSMMANAVKRHNIKSVMVFHPILSYLARDYGFNQIAIESEGKEPSPKMMKTNIDVAKTNGIKIIFVQQEFDTERATIIARQIGASVVKLDPLGYNWNNSIRYIVSQFEQANNIDQYDKPTN